MEKYDSIKDTISHIFMIQQYIHEIMGKLQYRALNHDRSKLNSPEKEYFDKFTPLLSSTEYDSPEYREYIKEMKVAVDFHHKNNRHHTEYFKNGIEDMNLIDIIEMLCDWKAATLSRKA